MRHLKAFGGITPRIIKGRNKKWKWPTLECMKNRRNAKNQVRLKRHARLRARVFGTASKPRLSVFRSNKHIFVQLVNDDSGNTLFSVSDQEVLGGASKKKTKEGKTKASHSTRSGQAAPRGDGRVAMAKKVGIAIAEKAKKEGISRVVFDRSGYQYHGIVKALAEGAQEGGLAL